MKRGMAALAAAIALIAPAAAQAPAQAGDPGCNGAGVPIRVVAEGMKDRAGRIKLELWPANESDFLREEKDLAKEGKFYARIVTSPPASGPVALCIRAPRAGRYGLVLTHDRDSNNKFGIFKDGVGVPGNQPLGRSKPKLANATVTAGPGGAQVTLQMQYLRGISGFGPAGR